jgi:atypical dual specificity phosphatase
MGRTGALYRRVRASVIDKPTFFTWVRDGKVAASGRPFSKDQVAWLNKHGVTSILTLTEEPLPKAWTAGIETRHIALKDHERVQPSALLLGADYIASAISDGGVVLVHCLAGKGRTGCVLAAYLMVYEGRTARQALDELRESRPGSVETAQEAGILELEEEAFRRWSSRGQHRGTTGRTRP